MNLFQLEYFVTVAERLHFARAAEQLHVAQPSLSFQIKQLEAEIGVRLFNRTTRRVELTAAGEQFLETSQQTLRALREGIDAAQRVEHGEQGSLVLGYNGYTLYNVLPGLLQAIRAQRPRVQLRMQETYEPFAEQQLLSGDLHAMLGIMGTSATHVSGGDIDHQDIAWIELLREPLYIAVPRNSPLTAAQQVRLVELADQDFVVMDRIQKPNAYAQTVSFCYSAGGFMPRIAQEALSIESVIGLVAAGAGVAFATHSLRELRADKVAYLRLIEPAIEVAYGLAWHRKRESPLVRALIETARL